MRMLALPNLLAAENRQPISLSFFNFESTTGVRKKHAPSLLRVEGLVKGDDRSYHAGTLDEDCTHSISPRGPQMPAIYPLTENPQT